MSTIILRDMPLAAEPVLLARPAPSLVQGIAEQEVPQREATFRLGYEHGRAQGYTDGFDKGREVGYEEGMRHGAGTAEQVAREQSDHASAALRQRAAELAELIRRANELIAAIEEAAAARLQALESDLLTLCLDATAAAFGSLAGRGDGIRALVIQSLATTSSMTRSVVRLHPTDAALLGEIESEFRAPPCEIVSDASLRAGACIVESAQGSFDASLQTQLARVAAVFLQARREVSQCPA